MQILIHPSWKVRAIVAGVLLALWFVFQAIASGTDEKPVKLIGVRFVSHVVADRVK